MHRKHKVIGSIPIIGLVTEGYRNVRSNSVKISYISLRNWRDVTRSKQSRSSALQVDAKSPWVAAKQIRVYKSLPGGFKSSVKNMRHSPSWLWDLFAEEE